MRIVTAKDEHLPGINQVLSQYFPDVITTDHLGSDSIALVLVDNDQVLGFLWAALLANKTEAYIQHFALDKSLHGQMIGALMAVEIATRLLNLGIKRAFAHYEDQNLYGMASLTRSLQVGGTLSSSTFKMIEFTPSPVSNKIRN